MRTSIEAPEKPKKVMRAPKLPMSSPPIRWPVPLPRPKYTPCRMPCTVASDTDGTDTAVYAVSDTQMQENVAPAANKAGNMLVWVLASVERCTGTYLQMSFMNLHVDYK